MIYEIFKPMLLYVVDSVIIILFDSWNSCALDRRAAFLDHATELRITKTRNKELELTCSTQKSEVNYLLVLQMKLNLTVIDF